MARLFILNETNNQNKKFDLLGLKEALNAPNSVLTDAAVGASLVGIESENVDSAVLADINHYQSTIQSNLNDYFESEEQREAAANVLALTADSNALSDKLNTVGVEYFKDAKLGEFRAEMAMVAGLSVNMSGVDKLFFPPIDIGANFAGISINLKRYVTVGNSNHAEGTGEVTDFQKRHLTEALRDSAYPTKANQKLYPIKVTGTNENLFVDDTYFDDTSVGDDLISADLALPAKPVNLLALSRIPGGTADSRNTINDRIEEGGSISHFNFVLGHNEGVLSNGTTVGAGTSKGDTRMGFAIPISMFNTAQFIKGAKVGDTHAVHLNFDEHIPLSLTTTTATNQVDLKELQDLGYSSITVHVEANYKLNLHTGNLSGTFGTATVSGVYKSDDKVNYIKDVSAALISLIDPVLVGQRPNLNMSNQTLRLTGDRVDWDELPFTYQISGKELITAERPYNDRDNRESLEVMTCRANTIRETSGTLALLNTVDELDATYGKDGLGGTINPHGNAMCGITYLDQPFVHVETINVNEIIDVEETTNKTEGVSSAIVQLIADTIANGITKSGILRNKRIYGNAGAKLKFGMATTEFINRYVYTLGDERTLGSMANSIDVNPERVTTDLDVMKDTIILAPVADSADDTASVNPWIFGQTLQAPTMIHTVELDRNGGKLQYLQMQPFYERIVNTPFVIKFVINGLDEYIRTKVTRNTKAV